jgi:hypothetical protein
LERVRKGEDVYDDSKQETAEAEPESDVDDELDRLEEKEVSAVAKEKTQKKGQLAPVALAPGKKRTRDQILAELKAAREAAKANAENHLGDRFRKIGIKQKPGSRIERDRKGREVLIIIDEDGHEKRKVRKLQPGSEDQKPQDLMIPDKNAKPLGMEVPEIYRKEPEPEDDGDVDIFDDVGDDYDPLAGIASSSDEDSDEDEKASGDGEYKEHNEKDKAKEALVSSLQPGNDSQRRNYFKDSKTELVSSQSIAAPSMSDPAFLAALKKAAQLNPISTEDPEDKEAKARAEKHKRMLQVANRDDEDLDMGFGTSRFEDEEDLDETKIKLSEWGHDDDDDDKGTKGGKSKRKRGPKKRKGDVNNAADIMRVIERRKTEKS